MILSDQYTEVQEEESYQIIRDSIMNFEIGSKVKHFNKSATVAAIDGNYMTVCYNDGEIEKLHYSRLHVVNPPNKVPANIFKKWSDKDEKFLLDHFYLPNANLARLLDRSEASIVAKRCNLKKSKK